MRHLRESGAVYRRQQSWSYYAEAGGAGIPQGVREVVGRRLGRLTDEANRALVLAAVIGIDFELALLESTLAEPRLDSVLDAVEEAVWGQLVVETGPGTYRFAHALVRDAIYTELSSTRRARLHYRVGEAIEAADAQEQARADVLVHHYAKAASVGGGSKAGDYALVAGRRLLARAAWEDAIATLDQAMAALAQTPDDHLDLRFELLNLTAEILTRHFAPEAALVRAQDAVAVARRTGVAEQLAGAALSYLAAAMGLRGPARAGYLGGAITLAEQALAGLDRSAPALQARLLARLALQRLYVGDAGPSMLDEALKQARCSGDPSALADALTAACAGLRGSPQVVDHLTRAEELVGADVPEYDHLVGHWQRAMARLASGDRPGFEADFRFLDRRGRERRAVAPAVAQWPITLALMDGRFDEADAGLAGCEEERGSSRTELCLRQRVRLCYELGDLAGATAAAKRLVEEWPDNPMHVASHVFLLAEHDAANSGPCRAEDFVDMVPPPMSPERWPVVHAYRAEVTAVIGGVARALRLHEEFLPWRGQMVVGGAGEACIGAVERYLGMLATVGQKWADAEDHFAAAEALEARMKAPPLLARTQFWHGRMLAVHPDGERGADAVAMLQKALATAGRLGMTRLHTQASKVLSGLQ